MSAQAAPHRTSRQPLPSQPSHATLCSLRGGDSRPHPLRQNPPSLAASFDDAAFDDIPLAPPPSALTSRPSHYDPGQPSPLDNYSPIDRRHQRSLTDTFFDNCRPLVNRATSSLQQTSKPSLHSPTKSLASFIPSRAVPDSAVQAKPRAAKLFSDWFSGSSAPVALGVTSRPPEPEYSENEEEQDSEDSEDEEEREDGEERDLEHTMGTNIFTRAPIFNRTATSKRPSTAHSTPAPASTSSKFSWLLSSTKADTPSNPAPTNYHNPSDELLNLDITHTLFPHGPVDPLAPSSFHDLLSSAENLLTRYQSSYRALSSALSDARAEQSAQDDELDEAETRARHLKMQLNDMAARAVEQDSKMQRLYDELRMEKERRKEEEEARLRSLAMVRGPDCVHGPHCAAYTDPPEDKDATPRKHKRVSGSGSCVSDSGFESECDSVFSRRNGAMSPTDTLPSSAASEADFDERDRKPTGPPQLQQRRSTYDRVLGELPLHQRTPGTPKTVEIKSWGCSNCEGGAQSSVWGRLAREREQNSLLKRRVQELEAGVEESLDLIFMSR